MASRGVSLVYGLGDEATRQQLVAQLVASLQGGPKAQQAVKLGPDTQLSVGQLPASSASGGGGGSSASSSSSEKLTTYKELCTLATDLGQPALLYQLMDIAAHAQVTAAAVARPDGTAAQQHMHSKWPAITMPETCVEKRCSAKNFG